MQKGKILVGQRSLARVDIGGSLIDSHDAESQSMEEMVSIDENIVCV